MDFVMINIFLDPGHGGKDPGAIFRHLQEKHLTLKLATYVRDGLLSKNLPVHVKMSRTADQTVSLSERTRLAHKWGADLFLSLHINAGGGSGYEDFIHTSLKEGSKTAKLRHIIHQEVIKRNKLHDRGKKRANFYVLRQTNMPAILTENGFIDSVDDRRLLQSDEWMKETAKGFVQGIINAFHLQKQTTQYKVIAGSFRSRLNAQRQMDQLKKHGFNSYILEAYVNNQRYFRVVVGSFSNLTKATNRKSSLKQKGFSAFIIKS